MKTMLRSSIVLNFALVACLAWLMVTGKNNSSNPTPPVVTEAKPQTVVTSATPLPTGTPANMETKPFSWSQLATGDYLNYIKNLRRIGCPEPTLRAIVTADVDAVYQKRDQVLEKALSDLMNSPWSVRVGAAGMESTLRADMQKIPDEETADVASLLGLNITSSPTATSASDSAITSASNDIATPTQMAQAGPLPLVFQPVDPKAMHLTDNQLEVIQELQTSFNAAMSGANLDPNDPAYRQRWQTNQRQTDEMLAAMLGRRFSDNYQMQAEAQTSSGN